jgi:multiple sugar transport system permease protein
VTAASGAEVIAPKQVSGRRLRTTTPLQRKNHTGVSARGHKARTILSMILLIVMALYFLVPIWWLLVSSTKSTNQLYNTNMFALPSHLNLGYNLHWLSTYEGSTFWRWFLNSVIYAGGTGVLCTLISAMAGYTIAKYKFRGKNLLSMAVLGALMVPSAAMTIPVFLMLKDFGMLNSYLSVILPLLFNPFGVYFMMVYIGEAMPDELIDAGRMDGASDYSIFFRVGLRIIRPGLVTLFLIVFVSTWNNFFLPLVMLNKTSLYPVTLGLQIWSTDLSSAGTGEPLYPLIIIGAFISILPMLILFPILRRYIVSGITLGSVK